MRGSYDRSIRLDVQTYERIKSAATQCAVPTSTWIRMAIRNQLRNETTKTEVNALREELAASLGRVLDQCRMLSNAQQAAIAIVDTLAKYILSISPEPGPDAQKLGRRRYEQFVTAVTTAMEGDVLRALSTPSEDDKKSNAAEAGTPARLQWKR